MTLHETRTLSDNRIIQDNQRNVPLAYLRAFLTLLVVFHHAAIAYLSFAPPAAPTLDTGTLLWTAFPIVDSHHWTGADLITSFNDTFFMSLMFLVSGVFAWPSLVRKGASSYFGDRVRRLGIPFVVAAGVLAPLAYCPTWLAYAGPHTGSFWSQWMALGVWPAGPAWFLWVLLAFGGIAAAAFKLAPDWGSLLGRLLGWLGERPVVCFLALLLASALAYLPMASAFDPSRWISFGPFFVQVSRVPQYLLYFVVGIGLGAYGSSRGLLQQGGRLARRWPLWVVAAVVAFVLSVATVLTILSSIQAHGGVSASLAAFGNFTFVLSCAASSFAALALFVRFAQKARGVLDQLDANAYGIYLLHYACVTWLQLGLLQVQLPGYAKAVLVFAGAVALSWGLSAALRKLPVVARFV